MRQESQSSVGWPLPHLHLRLGKMNRSNPRRPVRDEAKPTTPTTPPSISRRQTNWDAIRAIVK
jgi:hypothetical protein